MPETDNLQRKSNAEVAEYVRSNGLAAALRDIHHNAIAHQQLRNLWKNLKGTVGSVNKLLGIE